MVTIKDIAQMANVSRSTVSRVLNNSGYVSEDARERVEKVIEETGYVPSEYAKSLRTKKTKVIGVILPTIQTETPSRIVTGLGKELEKHGYQILLTNTNLDKDKELEYLDLLKMRQVDGIILIATNTEPKLIKKIKQVDIPVVIVGQESEEAMCVSYDDYHAARELTSFLISKGHVKIAFIGVNETDHAVGYLRKKGFFDEMESRLLPVEKDWIQQGIFDIDSGHASMERIITDSQHQPTATIAVTDRLAIGAMSYLKKQGIQIPEAMAIAGIGASEMSQYIDPPLTTIDYQNEKAGTEAAKQILARIYSQKIQEKIILDYRLIIRNSV
ncbi:LacI family sucrose operon transcriptional repressor [Virgibacillus natechei]|uniref:LacI family sucrose operon transcriptional repressor n=1 Tax=Virgibacillus natechei TaxID=1216297 RepID=A0ABS4IK93_9BACI|nr:LacI family DNA-binding transcriptional regulator [Virgibacillus natechei]MBP1971380.1 LacI family sucrose operon transcriptional repressor [Virgibacillus natechei]UZD12247.1 LacI family transcriptional regulator [Virgibacillus natechei]